MTSQIMIIDIGPAHKGLMPIAWKEIYARECQQRGLRFLPKQVINRVIDNIEPNPFKMPVG